MPRARQEDYLAVKFEDNSSLQMTPREIARLCYDPESWWNVVRMLAGYSDYSILKIAASNRNGSEEARAAVFIDEPPYNWTFPETV
jgi:hypothetical protein